MTQVELTLGELLQIHRQRAGLSKQDVCRQMRIVQSTLRNWESDRTIPRDRDLLLLCDILDIDAETVSPGIKSRCSDTTAGDAA